MLQRCSDDVAQGPDGITGGSRIAGVRLDKNGRLPATQEIARKILRYINDELNFSAREHILPLTLGRDLPNQLKIAAVLNTMQERASLRALVGKQHGCRQMFGV